MMGITGALSTLELTERPAPPKNPSHSLNPPILLPGRSPKFLRGLSDDETETSEQPVDFSKKYCETKISENEKPFDIYAETDLDQPTDYSLRYAEGDTKNLTVNRKQKTKSEFSSGLMSPEEPVNYCEEGTPGYFSRVPSCGSLNSISDPPKQTPEKAPKEERPPKTQEPKAVKFEEVVNYAEETPLMFSRSSSLASLDSIEQHSIHDDRSSVVSDLSRLTSGVISPSELPDSPSQTMPPSPRPRKTAPTFPQSKKEPQKLSVFEDDVKKFKVESTPIQFSTATSLSSLVDEVDSKEQKEEKPVLGLGDLGESSDEDILEACINRGITNNRYNKNAENENLTQPELKNKFDKNDVSCDSLRTYCTEGTPAILSHAGSNTDLSALSIHFSEKESEQEASNDTILVNATKENSHQHSQNSSFSSLTDESETEALLEECILAGMPKSNSANKPIVNGENEKSLDELSDLSDEDNILENCIKIGIENNKYSQLKIEDELKALVSHSEVGDTVKSYCTEDTPAGLSKAGSCSNLSVLSVQDNGANLTDIDSEDEEELLGNCMKFGMAAIAQRRGGDGAGLIQDTPSAKPRDYSPLPSDAGSASFSEDSESDEALLQQCIQAGMPKPKAPPPAKSSKKDDLTPAEKELLEKCILEGMRKCQTPKRAEDESSELTEAEHALLRQCILAGMQKSKNLARGGVASASGSRESTELTESERLLLQQCILAGMPKSKKSSEVGRSWRREKEEKGHTCCVHCPRNKERVGGHSKGRRKGRERVGGHREDRDVSIVYVASQILAIKKEVTRSEKWV